jgi:hypothetical protein
MGFNFRIAYSRKLTGIDEERLQDDVICRGLQFCGTIRAMAMDTARSWAMPIVCSNDILEDRSPWNGS